MKLLFAWMSILNFEMSYWEAESLMGEVTHDLSAAELRDVEDYVENELADDLAASQPEAEC